MPIRTNVGTSKKDDFSFEVKEQIFELTPRENGKQIRLDLASWNGGEDKYESGQPSRETSRQPRALA